MRNSAQSVFLLAVSDITYDPDHLSRSKHMEIKFSDILRDRLKDINVSQLAKELNIPKSLLFDWVGSRRLPNLKNMSEVKKLALYFDMSLDELIFGGSSSDTLSSITFKDDDRTYIITIKRSK